MIEILNKAFEEYVRILSTRGTFTSTAIMFGLCLATDFYNHRGSK